MSIDIVLEDPRWATCDLERLAQGAEAATCACLDLNPDQCESSLLACDDARIAGLNAQFRGKPTPTNVLSWPSEDLSTTSAGAQPHRPHPDPHGDIVLGDMAISYDTCAREASEVGKSMADHVTHLVVHGLLHLLGYDHIRDPDATLMEQLEVTILGSMGLDDPYREKHGA